MARERIGGVPYEAKKVKGRLSLRFFPKSNNAKNPDGIVFTLHLVEEDKKKLADIIKWITDNLNS